MYVITQRGMEAYNLAHYDKIMLLHGDTIVVSRKGELESLGKYDDGHDIFIKLCEAMGRGDTLFSMPCDYQI